MRLISSVLNGPALLHWSTHIQGRDTFAEIVAIFKELEGQFDAHAHRRQIESLAYYVTIEAVRKKQGCSRVSALGFLYHEVSRLNAQFRKFKQGGAFSTPSMMKSVEKYEWS